MVCHKQSMSDTPTLPRHRLQGLDVLRGIAVCAMILYHFTWDLKFFRFIEIDVVNHWFWAGFARAIAGSFLLISGVSLALAAADGLDRAKFLRRLAVVGGAAALVTVGTWMSMPDAFIFFGILHCIALGSVLALPFLRLPVWLTAAVATLVFALPYAFTHPLFNQSLLRWIGLGTIPPITNDYVPLFPWFALVLAGVVLGRLISAAPPRALMVHPGKSLDWIGRAGRYSLPIYLVHQPVLLAFLGALAIATPTAEPDRVTRDFRIACEDSCAKAGGEAAFCMRYCTCAEADIRKAELWKPLIASQLTTAQSERLKVITDQCTAAARQ
jgi:uncharacterized membrane protein